MKAWWFLLIKELELLFVTPAAYVVVGIFWAASGFFFSFNALYVSAVEMVTAFHNMSLLLMLMMPLISMRSFAEERQSGTYELIESLPISDVTVVLAKYCALLTVIAAMLLGSAIAVVVLAYFSDPDLGPILGGYAGLFLLAASFAAIGILTSCVSSSQLVAAVTTWAALLFLWFIDYLAGLAPQSHLVAWFNHISFSVQYLDLIRGVLTLGAVTYFVSLSVCALVAANSCLYLMRR